MSILLFVNWAFSHGLEPATLCKIYNFYVSPLFATRHGRGGLLLNRDYCALRERVHLDLIDDQTISYARRNRSAQNSQEDKHSDTQYVSFSHAFTLFSVFLIYL